MNIHPSLNGFLLFLTVALFSAGNVYADTAISGLDIVVTGKAAAGGKVATDASGAFSFTKLAAGNYTVSMSKESVKRRGARTEDIRVDIFQPKRLRSLHAERLLVGFPISVSANGSITGQVFGAAIPDVAIKEARMEKVKANVKVMNGKRYVWVPAPIGSNMGGKWALEGSDEAVLSTTNKKGGDSDFLRLRQGMDARDAMGGQGGQ